MWHLEQGNQVRLLTKKSKFRTGMEQTELNRVTKDGEHEQEKRWEKKLEEFSTLRTWGKKQTSSPSTKERQ